MSYLIEQNKNLFSYIEQYQDRIISKSVKKGESIYMQEDEPLFIFQVKKGHVALTHNNKEGKEQLLRVFNKGQCFGHRSLIAKSYYHATAIALTNVELLCLKAYDFQEIIKQNTPFLYKISQNLARELKQAEIKLSDLSNKKVNSRIIFSLLFLKAKYPDYQWSRKEIGDYCGAKIETVSRLITKLESEGLLKKEGRNILIEDTKKLTDFADQI